MIWRLLTALLWVSIAAAQPVVQVPARYTQCKEVAVPGNLPPTGQQLVYCKAGGAGWCSMNSAGTESCTGGTGGGGGISSLTCGDGTFCSTGSPITSAGTLAVKPCAANEILQRDGTGASWICAAAAAGPTGPTGPIGLTGPAGSNGATGPPD